MTVSIRLGHIARGAAIGMAEAVPGVSGGTIALVTGVYEKLIASAGFLINGVRFAALDVPRGRGWVRAGEQIRHVHWVVVVWVAVGMLPGLLLAARLLEPVLERYPEETRGLFIGLVLAAMFVPILMLERPWRVREVIAAIVAAVAAFSLTGLPAVSLAPTPLLVMFAAALAVCALVLPGVSGSFLLLTLGLYEPTIEAVNNRDFGYLAVFAVGMVLGLSVFVKLLQWLLEHRRRMTLAVLTGVIAGSLRALWPWQTENRELLTPGSNLPIVLVLFVIGVAVVLGMILLERRNVAHGADNPEISAEEAAAGERGRPAVGQAQREDVGRHQLPEEPPSGTPRR